MSDNERSGPVDDELSLPKGKSCVPSWRSLTTTNMGPPYSYSAKAYQRNDAKRDCMCQGYSRSVD